MLRGGVKKGSPPPPPRITAILRQQMNPHSRAADSRRKPTIRYHPCTLISDTDIYDPGIMRIPSPSSSQRHDMKKGSGGHGNKKEPGNHGDVEEEEEICEQVEESRLRCEVRNVKKERGNFNIQQIGSILKNSGGK